MKQGSTIFLRVVIFLIGGGVLALCAALFPSIISPKVGFEYFRPLFLGMYVPAIPFFFALHQALKLLSYIDKNKAFSEVSVKALKNIKYCGVAISALYVAGMPYIIYVADKDDAPGAVGIGLIIIFASAVIATAAAVFQKLVQHAVDIKSENDLTV